MPRSIPNTTLADAHTEATTFGLGDTFEWGFFTVANNPAFVQIAEGLQGQHIFQEEVYCPPATYPIARGGQPIAGLRARNAVAGSNAQFFGSLFYPREPGIQAGTPFSGNVSPGGAISVAQLNVFSAAQSGASQALTQAFTDVAGCSVTFDVVGSSAKAVAWLTADFDTTALGWGIAQCQLNVDGALLSPQAIWAEAGLAAGSRMTISNHVPIPSLSIGSHTIKLQANKSINAGAVFVTPVTTNLIVLLIDQ